MSNARDTVRFAILDGIASAGVDVRCPIETLVESIESSIADKRLRWALVEFLDELNSQDTHGLP